MRLVKSAFKFRMEVQFLRVRSHNAFTGGDTSRTIRRKPDGRNGPRFSNTGGCGYLAMPFSSHAVT